LILFFLKGYRMKNIFLTLLATLTLTACATPTTTLKHPKTGQVAVCGGGMGGSLAGGMIGHSIQKNNDEKCVGTYKAQGFKVVTE
jgi:hypothetical protein